MTHLVAPPREPDAIVQPWTLWQAAIVTAIPILLTLLFVAFQNTQEI